MAKEFGRIIRPGAALQCFGGCKGKEKQIEALGATVDSATGSGLKGSASGGISVKPNSGM